MTAEWLYRQTATAGRLGAAALRKLLSRRPLRPGRRRFVCRAEEYVDESCPQFEDRFLRVWISGGVPTPEDNLDTDICVELHDITDGSAGPEAVLSVSPQWRRPDSPVFCYQKHNGVIPFRDAVLAEEAEAARIPFHLLRFAYRGRRKIRVSASVVAQRDGRTLAEAQDCVEYVFCSEGFVELQERRENVLRACVELACAAIEDRPVEPCVVEMFRRWIEEKTRHFVPRSDVAEPLGRFEFGGKPLDADAACECLLSLGQNADRAAAADLALQAVALYPSLSDDQEEWLWEMADALQIKRERFMVLCQKRLLNDDCPYERWRLLLGVRDRHILSEDLRRRLNEEYRKWNARVTHFDPRIRRQADIILSLIAEVRNRHQKAAIKS